MKSQVSAFIVLGMVNPENLIHISDKTVNLNKPIIRYSPQSKINQNSWLTSRGLDMTIKKTKAVLITNTRSYKTPELVIQVVRIYWRK